MQHARFVLAFVLVLSPWMGYVPLAALSAVLLVVAWNISEVESFRHTLSAPKGDRLVLLATFGLTVFFDLTLAIQVGVVLAAFVFMARMSETVEVTGVGDDEGESAADADQRGRLPPGVEAFQISGPLFFGAASRLDEVFDQFRSPPRAFILRLRRVPVVDASGVHAFRALWQRCRKRGVVLVVSGLQPQPRRVFERMGLRDDGAGLRIVDDFEAALALTRELPGADG
jgi:SulP family sulfate permease